MALIELASECFSCDRLVICLERNAPGLRKFTIVLGPSFGCFSWLTVSQMASSAISDGSASSSSLFRTGCSRSPSSRKPVGAFRRLARCLVCSPRTTSPARNGCSWAWKSSFVPARVYPCMQDCLKLFMVVVFFA